MATLNKDSALKDEGVDITMHRFGEDVPAGWQPSSAYSLELFYRCQGEDMEFSYEESFFSGTSFALKFGTALRTAALGEAMTAATTERKLEKFVPADVLVKELDLRVRENCTVIIRAADGQELTWRSSPEPIMAKDQDRRHLYFGLRMIDDADGRAYKPHNFPTGAVCKQISFGARVLPDWFPEESHAFGLHLRAQSCVAGEGIVDVNIDPDIKNPSA